MPLFKVTVNGKVSIVDAASKSTAQAWGHDQREKLVVEATPANAVDLDGVDLKTVPTILPKGKAAPKPPVDLGTLTTLGGGTTA